MPSIAPPLQGQDSIRLNRFIEDNKERFVTGLSKMVAIPTVSADPPYPSVFTQMAEYAQNLFQTSGGTAKIVPTNGNPVVVGLFHTSPNNPTITVYNHLDVQPATESSWTSDPFTLRIDKDRYFGRGATDDKGPALTAFLAASFAAQEKIPLNIRFIWEMEEEVGSRNFESFVKTKKSDLKTDGIVVSDTIWISARQPVISTGLRGLLCVILRLKTGQEDRHSGLTGGVARNAIGELCDAVCRLHNPRTGEVLIPGFYKKAKPPTKKELADFEQCGFSVSRFKRDHKFHSMRSRDRLDLMRRIWAEPTFEMHGIVGGHMSAGVKTIVPQTAEAKISMRLVPDQDPNEIFHLLKKHLKSINTDITVKKNATLSPFKGVTSGPLMEMAEKAMQAGFGRMPVRIREGGSIGALPTLQKYLKVNGAPVPVTFLGLSLPEHGYHAPNENFDWRQAEGGIKMFVRFFEETALQKWQK